MIKDNFVNAPLGNFVSFIKACGADINDITLGQFCKICEDSIADCIDGEYKGHRIKYLDYLLVVDGEIVPINREIFEQLFEVV